ncbi:MAG: phosphoserine phosphatase SerB [Micavibrio sp.]|nr:phosphoserine phosphatase SerB [Micavibrio sp.]|tara:strand:+ start:1981 stop:2883 length:903 start_codon:yes stop_codon:yes gene_type:complete
MSYVLTLVASDEAHPITKSHIKEIGKIIDFYNLSFTAQPVWLAQTRAVDLGISDKAQGALIAHLHEYLAAFKIDLFCNAVERRRKKLLLADMDSTIVSSETLDELAAFAGIKDQVAEITRRAMEGQLDFHDALRERVKLLKGLGEDKLQETLDATEINPGARTLIRVMKAHNATCILVSGGFTFFTGAIANELGFDHHFGNHLEIKDGQLTGQVMEPIQDKHAKLACLNRYVGELGIHTADVITIGDGANDLPMLKTAGLGIGYHAKQTVKDEIHNLIQYGDLSAALYAQGYSSQQIGNV